MPVASTLARSPLTPHLLLLFSEIKDTTLRVVFSAYLLAMKLISDVSYTNSAFLRRCPWTQSEINSMEREMLHHLDYDAFIASGEYVFTPIQASRSKNGRLTFVFGT